MYVGLDLSIRNTGIGVIRRSGSVWAESIGTSADKFDCFEDRVRHIVGVVLNAINSSVVLESRIDVIIEGYAYGARTNNLTALAELKGAIVYAIRERYSNVRFLTVATTQMKKYVTGSGRIQLHGIADRDLPKAKKQVIITAINGLLGTDIHNSDEADALGLALLGYHYYEGVAFTGVDASFRDELIDSIKKSKTED